MALGGVINNFLKYAQGVEGQPVFLLRAIVLAIGFRQGKCLGGECSLDFGHGKLLILSGLLLLASRPIHDDDGGNRGDG